MINPWTGYQPYYVAYGKARGAETPAALRAMDTEDGRHSNLQYIFWVDTQWREWCRETGADPGRPKTSEQHTAFAAWLEVGMGPYDEFRHAPDMSAYEIAGAEGGTP